MTHLQLAAWLHSLFRDPDGGVLSGWCEEYIPRQSTTVDGEVYFETLALLIIEKFHLKITT
jgi:hypothetical protein